MRPPAALLPTRRAVLVVAGMAPLALVIAAAAPAAWIVAPALGGALLVLVLLDGLFAGSLADLRVIAPGDAEVGEAFRLTVLADLWRAPARARPHAALACDPRLAPGGRITLALTPDAEVWSGTAPLVPVRRGTGAITTVWLRWTGPLGLAHRQVRRPVAHDVRIWPNIAPVRSPALQIFLRDAQFGLIARRIRGEGAEFEALTEYEPGMDRRRIDWKSSARHARLFAKEYEVERNNQIVFAFDCGQAMCEPVAGLPRIDRAVTAALTTAYVALKAQDRVALFGFAARPQVTTPFVTASRDFSRLQRAAAGLDYHPGEPNFTLALSTLAARLQRRSLIVLFSEFTDPTSAELMLESVGRLVERHVVLFVVMADAELAALATAPVRGMQGLAEAVTATTLQRQRALVLQRLRHLGVRVVEARHDQIGTRLLDAYLAIKREGRIG
ncbi:VWFA domain-containing protein [Novosphingobium lubricantis]